MRARQLPTPNNRLCSPLGRTAETVRWHLPQVCVQLQAPHTHLQQVVHACAMCDGQHGMGAP